MSNMRKTPLSSGNGGCSEQIQGHSREAQIAHLQDQLADLLFQADGDEKLDELLDQLEELDPLPDGLLSDPQEELERFHQQYAPVFETARASAQPSSRRRRLVKVLPVAAVLILLFCTMTAQAFGLNMFSAIAKWTSEIFRLNDASASTATIRIRPLKEGETAQYDSLEDALAAFGIDAPLIPQEIPERFKLVDVFATQKRIGVYIFAEYESSDESFQIYYKEAHVDSLAIEKEYGDVTLHFANNIEHFLCDDMGWQVAIWQNGDLECSLQGDISKQEITSILDSIYKE